MRYHIERNSVDEGTGLVVCVLRILKGWLVDVDLIIVHSLSTVDTKLPLPSTDTQTETNISNKVFFLVFIHLFIFIHISINICGNILLIILGSQQYKTFSSKIQFDIGSTL